MEQPIFQCSVQINVSTGGLLSSLRPFSSDPPSQLDVLGHDGDPLGVDGTQIGVLEKTNQVCLASRLKSHNSRRLKPQISLEVLSNLPHQPLEWKLPDQQLRGLLVSPDFPESHSSWPVSVWFLDTSGCRSRLASSLCSELFPWSLSSSGLTSGLLSSGHCCGLKVVTVCV